MTPPIMWLEPVIGLDPGELSLVSLEAEPTAVDLVDREIERLLEITLRVDSVGAQSNRVSDLAQRLAELDSVDAVVPHPVAGRLDDEDPQRFH